MEVEKFFVSSHMKNPIGEPLFTDALLAGHGRDVDYPTLFYLLLRFSCIDLFDTIPCASTIVCHDKEPTAGHLFRIDRPIEVP